MSRIFLMGALIVSTFLPFAANAQTSAQICAGLPAQVASTLTLFESAGAANMSGLIREELILQYVVKFTTIHNQSMANHCNPTYPSPLTCALIKKQVSDMSVLGLITINSQLNLQLLLMCGA